MRRAVLLAVALAACGDDGGGDGDDTAHDEHDAASPADAAGDVPDADPNAPDAEPAPDAAPSPVAVVTCPQNPDGHVGTSGFAYDPESQTISVGDVVHFQLGASHNAQSDDNYFTVPFGGDVCLRFDVAGNYGFFCTPHGFTGSITVQ